MDPRIVAEAYKKTEGHAFEAMTDPHQIISTMLDALLKSMTIFVENIDIVSGGDASLRSKHFSRALTIIYALQSSLDFEKGGDIATNLFQLYEYARQQLIKDLTAARVEQTATAITALTEIKTAWDSISSEVSDAR